MYAEVNKLICEEQSIQKKIANLSKTIQKRQTEIERLKSQLKDLAPPSIDEPRTQTKLYKMKQAMKEMDKKNWQDDLKLKTLKIHKQKVAQQLRIEERKVKRMMGRC
jgi:FtsZ-binding cell division protein ZapB